MRSPGITVVIPTHPPRNVSGMTTRAVGTALAQTLPAAAIIVTTDTEREGAWATRNRGLFAVQTEWTAFLDSDDELLPQHLSALLRHQETTGADLIYPWFSCLGGTDPLAVPVNGELVTPFGVPFGKEQEEHLVGLANFIPVTVLVRTELAQRIGGFPQPGTELWPHPVAEDWGFMINIVKGGGKIAHLPEITWHWHHHGGGYPGVDGNTSGSADRW